VVEPEEALEAVARHAEAVATVRAFAERSGAERVVALVDAGEEESRATLLECRPDGQVELTHDDRTWTLPAGTPVQAAPRPVPAPPAAPASSISLDPETGDLEAPIGAVAALGQAVLELARALGGRSVATADFATRDPGRPLTIAAREGEPLVLAAGDRRFELPPEALW
jgi:hypothetical protein